MNESQLIDQLSAAMDEAASTVRAPAGAAERARKTARRRRLGRGLAAGAPAVGLAAGLLVAVSSPGAPPAAHPASQAHTPLAHTPREQSAVLTVAYVSSRASAALSRSSGLIVRTTVKGSVSWQDLATGAARYQQLGPGGKPGSDDITSFHGRTEHRVFIDYTTRTWWQLTSKVPAVPAKPAPPGALPVAGNSASGQVTILGRRTLNGRDTILVRYGPPRGFKPSATQQWPTERVWLDAASYLPLRITITGAGTAQEQNLTWLTATPANLAILRVTPPAGFKQVPPPLP